MRFPDTQFPQTFSEHTKATLNAWLSFLSGQGKRVIFIVDGLDHVGQQASAGCAGTIRSRTRSMETLPQGRLHDPQFSIHRGPAPTGAG